MKRESKGEEGGLVWIRAWKMRSTAYFHAKADEILAALEFPSPLSEKIVATLSSFLFFLSLFSPSPLPSSLFIVSLLSPPRFEESAVSTREGLEACRALAIQLRGTLVVRREKWRHFCATHDSILEDRKIRKRVVNGGFPRKIFRPSHGNARGSIRRMMARISFIPRHKYPSCQSRIIRTNLFSSSRTEDSNQQFLSTTSDFVYREHDH